MKSMLARLSFSHEPVAYVVAAIAVLVVVKEYMETGTVAPDALDAAVGAVMVVLGLGARQAVYTRPNVEMDGRPASSDENPPAVGDQ